MNARTGFQRRLIATEAFLEALCLTAMCPKEGCSFQGSLRDVMGHYKNCTSRTKRCTLCGEEVPQKLMSSHVADFCESRMLFCPYCEVEVEARNLENHMEDCDLRPANCTYCGEDFDTYAELRGEHLDVCPEKPVKCPYQRLGCKFQASNKEMESHLLSPAHGTLFMDRILKLEAQVQELRIENKSLKDSLRNVEDIQKEEEHLLKNMSDNHEDLMEKISELEAGAMQTHPDVDARVTELETKNAILHEPLGKLLDEIAKLK
uniref:Putative tnf receptor-associated factor 3 n=1 Tax=Amblyomma triste TaxID=251400 RepID=A0A023G4H3_AMBTT